jgi:type IV pilus assembly protein PilQ
LFQQVYAQKYSEITLRSKLDSVSVQFKGYTNKVQLNVSGLPLYELVNSIALENNLNITIDPSLNETVSYNFYDAQVRDVLVYVYDHFNVEYKFVGSILSIVKRQEKKEAPIVLPEKPVNVTYNPSNQFLSVDLKNDSLFKVMKSISTMTGNNIVISPDVRDKPISGYFLNRPFKQVIEMLGKANGLETSQDEDGITYVYLPLKPEKTSTNAATTTGFKPTTNFEQTGVAIEKNQFGTLDIVANNAEYVEIIKAVAHELQVPYFFYDKPEGKSSFELKNATFEDVLNLLFTNTKYAYKEDNRLYLIGEIKSEGIRVTETVKMQNRTIENVKTAIPGDLLKDLEVKEFEELNALIITGPARKVNDLRNFLGTIDVVVPMVQIDVMIILSDRSSTVSAGLKLGIGDKPTTTTGQVYPGVQDLNVGANAINYFLSAINGFGLFNLGAVNSNFYASLTLLESNGTIEVESTPKITTLSSHQASVSIGQTTYYQETRVDVQNSVVNQGVLSSKIWKSVDANLTVKIKPFVSSDGTVTLSITLTNDDFDGVKVDPTAPPNATKQTFESVIRVHDGDVVLLGGLDKRSNKNSGDGLPLLSRVPVLKWIFSKRTKVKQKYKLHILLRPTVTY